MWLPFITYIGWKKLHNIRKKIFSSYSTEASDHYRPFNFENDSKIVHKLMESFCFYFHSLLCYWNWIIGHSQSSFFFFLSKNQNCEINLIKKRSSKVVSGWNFQPPVSNCIRQNKKVSKRPILTEKIYVNIVFEINSAL